MLILNNKGQSLVLFVVIMPIILLMFVLVYDIGNAMYEKNKLSNVSYMVIDYALDNMDKVDENDLIDLIDKNTNNLSSVSVLIDNGKVNFISFYFALRNHSRTYRCNQAFQQGVQQNQDNKINRMGRNRHQP